MTELSIPTFMTLLPELFLPEQARGVSSVIYFDLSGEGGGDWTVTIRDQTCDVKQEKAETPDLTLHAKAGAVLDIFTGRLDPAKALLFGKLHMSGDMRLAMRLVELFDTKDERLYQWRR